MRTDVASLSFLRVLRNHAQVVRDADDLNLHHIIETDEGLLPSRWSAALQRVDRREWEKRETRKLS